ncbi:TonB-dependent siderophore receptor [Telmatospirillum sp.]|uniref:TonB-dependent siderophore receptor n=1 Tax=Telmatospirillum sp. TaxID=2079197 RepID=UPI00284E4A2B|nr:TonB-dependent siderophore receptor [Telmatospirillum sp.]MDR3436088.1 TonB-dependent siderophore receptor [Telmatospirillum sp.]
MVGSLVTLRRSTLSAFRAGVSLAALACAADLAYAADDATTPNRVAQDQTDGGAAVAVPKISISETKPGVSIGQPADAEGFTDYVVTKSTTGSKVETKNIDVPQDIVVIPHKIIEDQNNRSVTAAVQNVAGIFDTYPSYYALDQMTSLYIRGFNISSTLRDGLWDPTPFGNSWLGDVERIEVLKGPAGLLNGVYSGDIGGVVNVVTKKPLLNPAYTFESEFDSFGTRAIRADLSQPLTANKDWLMRVNLEEGVYGGFADHSDSEKRGGSAILQGKLTDDDAITVSYEKRWQQTDPYSGIVGYVQKGSGTAASLLRIGSYSDSRNLYDPRSDWTYETDTARGVYEHAFNANWRFVSSNQYTVTSRDVISITASPTVTTRGSVLYTESFQEIKMGPVNGLDTDNLINGKFSTFGLANDLTFGLRYADDWFDMNMLRPTNSFSSYTFSNQDNPSWYHPIVGVHQYMWGQSDTSQFDSYVNDVLSLTDRLKLSAGFNWANYYTSSQSGMSPSSQSRSSNSGDGIGWRAGLIYELLPGTALFGDYSTTFKPQSNNVTLDGSIQMFDPLTGDQYEVGVKSDIGDRASVTFALYQLALENQLQSDPDPARSRLGYEVNSGKQRSRGVELDGTYNLRAGWDLLTSYAYTNAKILRSDSYVYGSAVPNVPSHSARLWSVYEFQNGPLEGFGFGGGIRAVSSRTSTLVSKTTPNLYATLPGFATIDALAYYRLTPAAKITLNVNNLLDHRYYETASGYAALYPGAPLNGTLRLKVTF